MEKAKCPECKSTKCVKIGFTWHNRELVQRYRCKDCGRTFSVETQKAGVTCNE